MATVWSTPRAVARLVARARSRTAASLIGLDVGGRRIGVARTDPLATFAEPHGFVTVERARGAAAKRAALRAAAGDVVARARRARACAVIVGWPLQMDGSEGAQCEQVDGVVAALAAAGLDVPVARWDERLSTDSARQVLADAHGDGAAFVPRACLLYTSPSPRDKRQSRMPSSA